MVSFNLFDWRNKGKDDMDSEDLINLLVWIKCNLLAFAERRGKFEQGSKYFFVLHALGYESEMPICIYLYSQNMVCKPECTFATTEERCAFYLHINKSDKLF